MMDFFISNAGTKICAVQYDGFNNKEINDFTNGAILSEIINGHCGIYLKSKGVDKLDKHGNVESTHICVYLGSWVIFECVQNEDGSHSKGTSLSIMNNTTFREIFNNYFDRSIKEDITNVKNSK